MLTVRVMCSKTQQVENAEFRGIVNFQYSPHAHANSLTINKLSSPYISKIETSIAKILLLELHVLMSLFMTHDHGNEVARLRPNSFCIELAWGNSPSCGVGSLYIHSKIRRNSAFSSCRQTPCLVGFHAEAARSTGTNRHLERTFARVL
jgi:hypothetical protein